jgi:hypothetical protein
VNLEHQEAVAIDDAINQWCKTWHVDRKNLKEVASVDEHGNLFIQLEAKLTVPITSIKTTLNVEDIRNQLENNG